MWSSSSRKRRVYLFGYYGVGNFGDDLVLARSKELVLQNFQDCSITVRRAGWKTSQRGASFWPVRLAARASLLLLFVRNVYQASRASLLVLGGGGTVGLDLSPLVRLEYLISSSLVRRRGGKVAGLGIEIRHSGIPEDFSPQQVSALKTLLGSIDFLWVRDPASFELAERVDNHSQLTLGGDLFFHSHSMPVSQQRSNLTSPRSQLNVGLSLPHNFDEAVKGSPELREAVVDFCKSLKAEGARITSISAQEGFYSCSQLSDFSSIRVQLAPHGLSPTREAHMKTTDDFGTGFDPRVFNDLDVLVAGRFHVALTGIAVGLPVVVVPIGRKLTQLAELTGAKQLSDCLVLGRFQVPNCDKTDLDPIFGRALNSARKFGEWINEEFRVSSGTNESRRPVAK